MMGHGYQRTRTPPVVNSARRPGPADTDDAERWPRNDDADDEEIAERLAAITALYRQATAGPPEVYALARRSRDSLDEVLADHLNPWSSADIRQQLMAAGVLSAMANDELVRAAALDIAVAWARDGGQAQAVTAAIAFGGSLGQQHPADALPWLWALTLREEQISAVARLALGQFFAVEVELNTGTSAAANFLVHKIRPLLTTEAAERDRQAALSAVNSVLNAALADSAPPAVARLIRARQADLEPVSELWAAALNSVPHRRRAVIALHLTLAALTDHADAIDVALGLGKAIRPRLTTRTREVIELTLPDPQRTEAISARLIAAFLGAQREVVGAGR
jgi:hypothetical protein